MSLTSLQKLPSKENQPTNEWSFRKIFSLHSVVDVAKTLYNNIEEILCSYLVFVIGIAEVFGRSASWKIYVLTILIMAIIVVGRYVPPRPGEKPSTISDNDQRNER